MRTKNKKWIGPVPIAAVTALALAAFLAVGLLILAPTTPNGVPAAEAQGFDNTATALADTVKKCAVNRATSNVLGGPCTTTADTLDVYIFRADSSQDAVGTRAYVTGGSDFPSVQGSAVVENDNSSTPTSKLGKVGVDRHTIEFEKTTFSSRQEYKITITRSMADAAGRVYVWGYNAPDTNNSDLDADSTSLEGSANLSLRVQFVGKPAFGVDSNCDTDKTVDDNGNAPATAGPPSGCPLTGITTEIRSQVSAGVDTNNLTAVNNDGKMASHPKVTLTGNSATSAHVRAKVKDAANNPLNGEVTFTVTSNPASVASATRTYDTVAGEVNYPVSGLPTDKSYRVEIAVTFSGGTGDLDMGKVIINRTGDAETIVADTYNIACLTNDDATEDPRVYTDDAFDMDNKGCAPVDRFAREQVVVVKANLEDGLGNVVAGNLTIDLEDMDKPLDTGNPIVVSTPITTSPNTKAWVYTVAKDAALGEHDITLSSTVKDVADVVLPVAIAGPPVKYTVDPMTTYIPLRGRGTFTVTALDTNDGVPAFTMDDPDTNNLYEGNDRVPIDATYGEVRGAKVDGNDNLTFDTKDGTGIFTYILPRDAADGETFSIYVSSDTTEVEITVTAGEAPAPPGTPTKVMATASSRDMITVSWEAAAANRSAITGYTVQSGSTMDDGTMDWTEVTGCVDITVMTCPISGLMHDTMYTYRVAATNGEGTGEYASVSATTMANMAPVAPTLEDVSAVAGSTVDAIDASFTDEDDTALTYTVKSSDPAVATAEVGKTTGMVTIMAKSADSATITVTADDGNGGVTPATFMVTVTAAELAAPTDIKVNAILGTVTVEWTAGQSAEGHIVVLFKADATFEASRFLPDPATTHTSFGGVASGDYYVIVASYWDNAAGEREYAYDFLGTDVTMQ